MPVGVGGGTYIKNLVVKSAGRFVLNAPRWDKARNEIVVLELGAVEDMNYDLSVEFTAAFDAANTYSVAGQPVIPVLSTMGRMVEEIVAAIEAETARLFPTH